MYPGLTTFHHIINDSLMPWLSIFSDEKKLRRLVVYMDSDICKDENCYFMSLVENVNYTGIKIAGVLMDEWKFLAEHQYRYYSEPLFMNVKQILWQETMPGFYVMLAINCGFSHLYWMKETVENEIDERVISFKVMRSIRDIGQLIIDGYNNSIKNKSSEDIFDSVNMILSYVWLKILSLYHYHIFMDGLPIRKEEVIYNIIHNQNSTENLNILKEAILLTLNLLDEKTKKNHTSNGQKYDSYRKEMNIQDVNELSTGLRSEIDLVKSIIYEMATPKDENIEYIKPLEACLFLDISKTTLNAWRKKGKIKDFRFLGNRYEYNKLELNRLTRWKREVGRRRIGVE